MEETMPKYQIMFDTVKGDVRHNVDIDDSETLDHVLEEVLWELNERGSMLKGHGQPQVVCNSQLLDFSMPLPGQGVYPNDVLRVSTISING
jgi:hypothetical protein